MIIYNKAGIIILDIEVDDTSYRYRAIRQGDKVYLYFLLTDHIEIPTYSYILYQGQRYTLWKPENLTKNGERNLDYIVEFWGYWEILNRTKYKFLSSKPYKLKFPLTATPRMFMQLMIDCLNLHDSGWSLGTCIEASEKALTFSHETCMEVLNRLADEYNTEFEFIGKTINFGKVERFKDDPLPLSYGKGNGFKTGVIRQSQGDKAPVTILYAQGGERNIDISTYGSASLLLPKSQQLEYQGRKYKTDEDGMFITRADRPLVDHNEDGYDATNIYPSRVGTISEVITVDASKNFYDIKDSSIPDALDYSKCRIAGEKATIIFQSGILTGREFDLEQTDEALTGYVHSERRFKIVPIEQDGAIMPNETFKPAVGDKYAIFNISLPQAYICDNATQSGASWDMFKEAVRYMYENEEENFIFQGNLDNLWSKKKWSDIAAKLEPGSYIQFSDTQFQPDGILIRITGIRDYINKPHALELELSNTPVAGYVSSELGKIDSNEVKDEDRYNHSLSYTKRSWKDVKETQKMMFDPDGSFKQEYTAALLAEFGHLLIGMKSQQMDLVGIKFVPNADNNANSFKSTAGKLVHLTIKDTPTEWTIPASSHNLSGSLYYYVYAKCSRTGTTGSIYLTNQQIKFDSDSSYYYFWIGTLNTPEDNVRSWLPLYGYTEIAGQTITTGIIKDKLARLIIDLINARIIAKDGATIEGAITFGSGSSGLDNVAEWPAAKQDIANAKYSANQANQSVNGLSNYVDGAFADGIIEESEAKAIEKYINTVNNSKASVEATYNKLYVNSYLTGTAKSGLLNAKVTLFGAIDNLISAINSAIYDGRTTVTEKNNVDKKFSVFNSAMASFNTAVETANKAIQDKLKEYADNASSSVPDSFKNSLAQQLGYTNYAALESAANSGNTVIKNGKVNTTLVEAVAIVTNALAAQMITTGNLTVTSGAKIADFVVDKGRLKYVGTDFGSTAKMYIGNVENGTPNTAGARITAFGIDINSYVSDATSMTTSIKNMLIDNVSTSNKKTSLLIKTSGGDKNTAMSVFGNVAITGDIANLGSPVQGTLPNSSTGFDHNTCLIGSASSLTLPTGEALIDWFGSNPNNYKNYGVARYGMDAQAYEIYVSNGQWNGTLRINGNPSGNSDYAGISGTPLYGKDVVRSGYGYIDIPAGESKLFKKVGRCWYCY